MYQDILLGLDIKNLISKPTRITNNSETILDHILTNLPYDSVRSVILINDITDHFPIFELFNLSLKKRYYRHVYYRSITSSKKKEYINTFCDTFSLLQLETIEFDHDKYLEKVINAINTAMDKVFPLRKRSNKQLKKFKNPWITQGILNSRKRCHYLYYISLVKKDKKIH